MYHQGQGVDQDYSKALREYKRAAQMGNKYAQNTLGNMYMSGQGAPADLTQAIGWFEKAAALKHEGAISRLALLKEGLEKTETVIEPEAV